MTDQLEAPELRVAVVGFGERGELARWAHRPGHGSRVVVAIDPDPSARERALSLLGPEVAFGAHHRSLTRADVDAAIVVTPDDTHHAIARDLLRAGIAVYLEKPMAITTEDADDLLRVAYDTGTKLYVGHNMRHLAVVRLMREIIARGDIGEVKAVWCRHFVGNGGDYYFKDWHADRRRTNGLLLQKGAHDLDVIHWLAGSSTRDVVAMGALSVYGAVTDRRDRSGELMSDWFSLDNWPPLDQTGLNPVIDVEDQSMVLMRLECGALASYEQCHFTPDYWRSYTVIGTRGRLENFGDGAGGVVRLWNRRTGFDPDGDASFPIGGDADGHSDADELTVREFVNFVRFGAPTDTSPIGARQAVATAAAATASLRAGSVPRRVSPVDAELQDYFRHHQIRQHPTHRSIVTSPLFDIIARHKAGEAVGMPSVCSAHPLVLEAALLQALEDGGAVLVEATSNQVDQFGGYTGMRPADFRDLVFSIADRVGLPRAQVVLGGDHLGPNTWRDLGPAAAMERADALVEAYVAAGFTKIHLDCSMVCAGDPVPLTDDIVAERAARLAKVAEEVAVRELGVSDLLYVIGTEVPVPGGAHETIEALAPTSDEAARATLARHEKAFVEAGLAAAWERVVGLVVQPGVEFDHVAVVDYDRDRTTALRHVVDTSAHLVFEAHSTDYQTVELLTELVEDHWAILKVGPGLTFALREALFALAAIEDELLPAGNRSDLVAVVERQMLADPHWWQGYYEGDAETQRLARRYSYSDRVRYYWPDPQIHAAETRLLANLGATRIPLPLLSQHLPGQYARVRRGELAAEPAALAIDRVRDVLRDYARASNPTLRSSL